MDLPIPSDETPNSANSQNGFQQSGSPTLIKGLEPLPYHRARRAVPMAPLLWIGAVLIAIPWVLGGNDGPANEPVALTPAASPAPLVASSSEPASSDATTDQISMVFQVPAGSWIDTGIDMCGCTHVTVTAVGSWQTPAGPAVTPDGGNPAAEDTPLSSHVRRLERHDALAHKLPYGSLILRVGRDPFRQVGSFRSLSGNDFQDAGTLKLGMNAGRSLKLKDASGSLYVTVSGTGAGLGPPLPCDIPMER